jgi:hypothetical protein
MNSRPRLPEAANLQPSEESTKAAADRRGVMDELILKLKNGPAQRRATKKQDDTEDNVATTAKKLLAGLSI